jgi:hypothetical protein
MSRRTRPGFAAPPARFKRASALTLGLTLGLALALTACGGGPLAAHTDGLDPRVIPAAVQVDYGLFSDRCSKCHSLARALNSGIDSNEYWDIYVERMRRQPGSGISIEDTHGILRFLYYYAAVQRHAKARAE